MDPQDQSRRVAAVFDRAAATYEAVDVDWFNPIAAGLVPGRSRARRVGARHRVRSRGRAPADRARRRARRTRDGDDLSAQMVALTQADVDTEGLGNVDLQVLDASDPGLPQGTYDLIACSLVAFFLPDPAAAIVGWHDLLKPGGRLGLSTFGERDPAWVGRRGVQALSATADARCPHLG